jgi:tetratricopeptide (TPR) repeat protein
MNIWFSLLDKPLGYIYLVLGIVSILPALTASFLLRKKFPDEKIIIFIFFWIFNLSLPVVGMLMTAWIVYYLQAVKYEEQLAYVDHIDMSGFSSEFPEVRRIFGEASMGRILGDRKMSESLKMKALVSLVEGAGRSDIALIKNSLSDRNDEIRLYSFAIIDKLERGINSQIHQKLQIFHDTPGREERKMLAEELAFLYWDMVYFELADDDLKEFIIHEVQKYAKESLDIDPINGKLCLLLGRCSLMLKDYEVAEAYIELAVEYGGKNNEFMIPYLAEIHYNKREFESVKKLLENAEGLRVNMLLNPLVEQWGKGAQAS